MDLITFNLPKDKSKSIMPSFFSISKKRIMEHENQSVSMVTRRSKLNILLVVIKFGHHDYLYKLLLFFFILPSIAVYMVLSCTRVKKREKINILIEWNFATSAVSQPFNGG